MTPGYKTSEFWLSLVATVIGALLTSGILGDGGTDVKVVGAIASVLSSLGYTVSRTMVKTSEAPNKKK